MQLNDKTALIVGEPGGMGSETRLFAAESTEANRRMTSKRVQALAIVPLRVVVGLGFIVHGYAKWSRGPENFAKLLQQLHVPFALLNAWMVTGLELVGGLALVVGVGVLLFSVPLIASMLVAMFQLQVRYGFSSVNTIGLTPDGPLFGPPGYEINLLYIAALLALAALGPGPLSLDDLRRRYSQRAQRMMDR